MQCDFIFQNYWYLWYNQENNGMAEIVKKVKLLVTISRNAPCPCGSGRKYKHCCGKTKTVSLQSIVERELEECVFDVLAYAADRYEDEIVPFLEEWQTEGLPRRYDEKGNGYVLARKEQLERLLKFVTEL
jgi:hypothetical protein